MSHVLRSSRMTNEWVTVKIKEAVAGRFRKAIDDHPEQGFNSLAHFLTRAGLELALHLESGSKPDSPVTAPPSATGVTPSSVPPPAAPGIPSPEDEARGRSRPSPRRLGSGASATRVEEN